MATEVAFEYFFLHYAPNLTHERTIPLGIIFLDPRAWTTGLCIARFFPAWQSQVLRADPAADIDVLEALTREIERSLSVPESRIEMLKMIEDSFSNQLRVSNRHTCKTSTPFLEIESLISTHSANDASS